MPVLPPMPVLLEDVPVLLLFWVSRLCSALVEVEELLDPPRELLLLLPNMLCNTCKACDGSPWSRW